MGFFETKPPSLMLPARKKDLGRDYSSSKFGSQPTRSAEVRNFSSARF
jgi:hypothetical protein